ncbi:ubiquitin-conjugating protein [Martiniozyma asiatica (nom. inval.)]|nr:ubiquitin-conjugating protein [Martiniozyma asiatica]
MSATPSIRDFDAEIEPRLRSDTLNYGAVPMDADNNPTLAPESNPPTINTVSVSASDTVISNRDAQSTQVADIDGFFSVRLTPFIDHTATNPYMFFGPIIRRLKPGMTIYVGRYTEKTKHAATAASGSSEMVVFKSKVVSRKHAELSVDEEGNWYIKDTQSSSGTFLNHVRLSLPNQDSLPMRLGESDVIQLGVDYRGGSEEIYRCVRVKLELNGSWKRRGAKFSKFAHENLKKLTLTDIDGDVEPCVICLGGIKPSQAVFVSPCSHSWHYKCVRPLVVKTYPQFSCPNCKSICDLEEELETDEEIV